MCSSLLGHQGLEEKPNSPLKVFKAAGFILPQLDYKAIIQMAMPANLNEKYPGKRSCFAQTSFDLVAAGHTKCWHCWHKWVKSSWQGKSWVEQKLQSAPMTIPWQ